MEQSRCESDLPFPTTGIDQVKLTARRYKLRSSEQLTAKQTVGAGGELLSGELCVCGDGVSLDADRAYFNGPWWSVQLMHRKLAPLQIRLNPATRKQGDNYFPANRRQVREALEELQTELWGI